MKKKLLALTLCLVLLLASVASVAVSAEAATDPGYTYEEATDTYTVTTADGLLAVVTAINTGNLDANITLAADIDLAEKTWVPLGFNSAADEVGNYYKGTFDGANFTIKNLTYEPNNNQGAGLIANAGGGCTVKNLNVTSFNINNKSRVAAIIGYTQKDVAEVVTVENVHVRATTLEATANYGYAAGIIGEVAAKKTKINNCTVVLNVTAIRASGIVGGDSASNAASPTDTTIGIDISNTIVSGAITHKVVSNKQGDKYGASGFLGSHSTIPLTLTNCISVADMTIENPDQNSKGSFVVSVNKTTFKATNCIGAGPLIGAVSGYKDDNGVYPTVLTNVKIYDKDATTDRVSIFGRAIEDGKVTDASTMADITIDSLKMTDVAAIKAASVPVIKTANDLYVAALAIFEGNTYITEAMIQEIVAHEHVYDQMVEASAFAKTEPTCTEPGVYYKSCACGKYDEANTFVGAAALGHKMAENWTSDETNHYHVCSQCLEEKSEVAAHTFGDWTVTKEATEKREGERVKACTVCGFEVEEKIAKLVPETEAAAADPAPEENAPAEVSTGCGGTVIGIGSALVVALGAGFAFSKKKED